MLHSGMRLHATGDVDQGQRAEDVGLYQRFDDVQHEHRYRHQQAGDQEDQQRGHFEAHDVAEQAHGQRDGARKLAEQMKR